MHSTVVERIEGRSVAQHVAGAVNMARVLGYRPAYIVVSEPVLESLAADAGLALDELGVLNTMVLGLHVIVVSGPRVPIEVVSW